VVQAETASFRVPDLSDAARAELLSIGETARSALAETRALLSVLRQDGEELAAAPQPGLHQVGDLVDAARRAGVQLEARIDGEFDRLRPGVSLAAYRIVQEALANASRHAPGAPVRLEVDAAAQVVHVLVRNESPPGGQRVSTPSGVMHGITGMRERAAAAGGRLTLGPTEDGGFAVELSLPTGGEEQSPESSSVSVVPAVDPPGRSVVGAGEGTE
jgi:signal transduction histidine kinase